MDSNLNSAKQAIKAELAHARDGAAYYAARVEALENALQQLANVDTGGGAAPEKGRKVGASKRGRKPGSASVANGASAEGSTKGRKNKREGGSSLPTTGREFWFDLVSDQPQSAVEISNAAVAALGIKPSQKQEIRQLKQRVAPALASLVATHHINDSGAGRERRFFRSGNQGA